jgi:hypothetical protein
LGWVVGILLTGLFHDSPPEAGIFKKGVDGRVKPGHDAQGRCVSVDAGWY